MRAGRRRWTGAEAIRLARSSSPARWPKMFADGCSRSSRSKLQTATNCRCSIASCPRRCNSLRTITVSRYSSRFSELPSHRRITRCRAQQAGRRAWQGAQEGPPRTAACRARRQPSRIDGDILGLDLGGPQGRSAGRTRKQLIPSRDASARGDPGVMANGPTGIAAGEADIHFFFWDLGNSRRNLVNRTPIIADGAH